MSAAHQRRRETVYLYQGDDLDRLTELGRKYADAKSTEANTPAGSRLMCDTGADEAREEFNNFRDEAQARATKVVVEALGRVAWRDLVRANPAREQTIPAEDGKPTTVLHDDDAGWGVNYDTFPDALVPVSIVEPEFASDEDRVAFADDLSDPDFYRLFGAAWLVNRAVADPKALPVYDVIPESDAT